MTPLLSFIHLVLDGWGKELVRQAREVLWGPWQSSWAQGASVQEGLVFSGQWTSKKVCVKKPFSHCCLLTTLTLHTFWGTSFTGTFFQFVFGSPVICEYMFKMFLIQKRTHYIYFQWTVYHDDLFPYQFIESLFIYFSITLCGCIIITETGGPCVAPGHGNLSMWPVLVGK